jgi:hypothetical protein
MNYELVHVRMLDMKLNLEFIIDSFLARFAVIMQ